MRFVLLVESPAGNGNTGMVIWAWSDDDDGFLVEEAKKLSALGYRCVIYTEWQEVK